MTIILVLCYIITAIQRQCTNWCSIKQLTKILELITGYKVSNLSRIPAMISNITCRLGARAVKYVSYLYLHDSYFSRVVWSWI